MFTTACLRLEKVPSNQLVECLNSVGENASCATGSLCAALSDD